METISLPRGQWTYDPADQLGRAGGFGAVFAGSSTQHGHLAVKRLHLTAADAAHRELRLAEELLGTRRPHVMPIFDAGQDAATGNYFIVMPRADHSLQDTLASRTSFTDQEAIDIMLQIALGLNSISHIVHRDLKPANVLLHDNQWKVADFGIARFVEESTSLNTLKDCLTRPYAAPEQWRLERATNATDLYSLGCVGFALVAGHPPFAGPDFSHQHQHEPPPSLQGHLPVLQSLLSMLLRKPAQARPTLQRTIELLSNSCGTSTATPGVQALAHAGAKHAAATAEHEALQQHQMTIERSRQQLADSAYQILQQIADDLLRLIEQNAPTAKFKRQGQSRTANLGRGQLTVTLSNQVVSERAFPNAKWNVAASAKIFVAQDSPTNEWGASLWYTTFKDQQQFRWYEVAYYENPMLRPDRRQHPYEPFSLDPRGADDAHGPALGHYQVAYDPLPIDDENTPSFCDRWAALLARAADGKLERPRALPLNNWH